MIKVHCFTVNSFSENTYLIWDEETKESVVVDPGFFTYSEKKLLLDFGVKNKLDLKYMMLTHAHIDHILGCNFVKKNFDTTFFIPKGEVPLLKHAEKQAEMFGLKIEPLELPDDYINEGKKITIGTSQLSFLSTPGHTPDEYSIYIEDAKICFTGDVLFQNSIGRTDLWGGDHHQLMDSIKNKLLTLPDDVLIFPGHGDQSTIGDEKMNNPFLNNY